MRNDDENWSGEGWHPQVFARVIQDSLVLLSQLDRGAYLRTTRRFFDFLNEEVAALKTDQAP